jgi:hypothetical protein
VSEYINNKIEFAIESIGVPQLTTLHAGIVDRTHPDW